MNRTVLDGNVTAPDLWDDDAANTPRSVLVDTVLAELAAAGIRHCALRWSDCPRSDRGDVDILFDPVSRASLSPLMTRIAARLSSPIIFASHCECDVHFWIADTTQNFSDPKIVDFHFQSAISEGRSRYLDFETVFASVDQSCRPPRPAAFMEALIIVLRAVVANKSFKTRYWSFLRKVNASGTASFAEQLKLAFEPSLAERISRKITENDPNDVLECAKLFGPTAATFARRFLSHIYLKAASRMSTLFRPPGLVVSLETEDSELCSKTTDILLQILEKAPYPTVEWQPFDLSVLGLIWSYLVRVRPVLRRNGVILVRQCSGERWPKSTKLPLKNLVLCKLLRLPDAIFALTPMGLDGLKEATLRDAHGSDFEAVVQIEAGVSALEIATLIINRLSGRFETI